VSKTTIKQRDVFRLVSTASMKQETQQINCLEISLRTQATKVIRCELSSNSTYQRYWMPWRSLSCHKLFKIKYFRNI